MRDPAFLFYDGDAARDVSHMNRLERGCYFDLIQAQRKFGRMPEDLIKKILGKDFITCWDSIKICLTYDKDMYFIDWVENSTIKRKEYSESRRKNRVKNELFGNETEGKKICKSYDKHMENENENEIINEIINYLNKISGKKFKSNSEKTKKFILARLNEKYTIDQFKRVIDIKCKKWANDEKMKDYIRPETLFGTKFESYLNENYNNIPMINNPYKGLTAEQIKKIEFSK